MIKPLPNKSRLYICLFISLFLLIANVVTAQMIFYRDADGDGFGRSDQTVVAPSRPPGYASVGGDCDDWTPTIYPGAPETCNFRDDDCDGTVDEGCSVFYRDEDADNFGLWHVQTRAMTRPAGYAAVGGDCNDANAAVRPGAPELCNGIDDNCNGSVDEGCRVFFRDADGDNFGRSDQTIIAPTRPPGYALVGGDCDDWTPTIYPGAPETCNFRDDDCDGQVDEGCSVFYRDQDADGFGLWDQQIRAMTRPPGYSAVGGDCNDANAAIRPGAPELCNGIDDNCNGTVDEGCRVFFRDADLDNFGRTDQTIVAPSRPPGYALVGGDCDDWTPTIYPGAPETCNFRDDDCDGQVDEGCSVFYRDQDADNFGLWHVQIRAMSRPAGYALVGGDCNDANPAVRPGATELCNGMDDNCNGIIDEGCTIGGTPPNGRELQAAESKAIIEPGEFRISVAPNPATHLFRVQLQGNSKEKITIRVYNYLGTLVETRENVFAGQVIRIGAGYQNGTYILEATQGTTRKAMKIIKM